MHKIFNIIIIFSMWLVQSTAGIPTSFSVLRFGTPNKLGSISPEPEGSRDYILWDQSDLPEGPFPKQFSVCFNMQYLTMDYWSAEQKTILRIFQSNVTSFWLRINHSPPRGTMILNSGTLWSGGLGDFRKDFSLIAFFFNSFIF